ncbi:MAG: hypothetical protein E7464_05810 [Ruminococcaceae bacterium]|nr:hypothetical protein [Oscillospiraceae bacterium]
MELYQEMISEILAECLIPYIRQYIQQYKNFPFEELVKDRCYMALQDICDIIRDDRLNDEQCIGKIDDILAILELNGINTSPRHDY